MSCFRLVSVRRFLVAKLRFSFCYTVVSHFHCYIVVSHFHSVTLLSTRQLRISSSIKSLHLLSKCHIEYLRACSSPIHQSLAKARFSLCKMYPYR